ncbi:hypothetical protein [Cupriavidus necator]|uniref:hypothetical protein n=1 Tax=Cupriavidus necator TaxID=106590 RepID=UPI003F7380A1
MNRSIDFNKTLEDGSSLTDTQNSGLLECIKKFLCLQTHPALTGAVVNNAKTEASRVMLAVHILDYFLLRSEQFRIAEFGFELVTPDDVIGFIDVLTTNRRPKASIYDPMPYIIGHLDSVRVDSVDLESLRESAPYLFVLEEGAELVLSREQTTTARAWLKLNDFYVPGHSGAESTEYRLRVARQRLLEFLIGGRVLGELRFVELDLPGLDIAPYQAFTRELTQVPVNNFDDDDRASIEFSSTYVTVLNSMKVARQHGAPLLSDAALEGVEASTILVKERTKQRSRFTTLPFHVANELLGNAITFYLENGEALVETYLALASKGEHPEALGVDLPAELRRLGVTTWTSSADSASEFFSQLRNGTNLFNMLEVLWGSIAIILGSLTARRLSEIEDLTAASIVEDRGAYYLALDLRKANVRDHRKRVLRPMPGIAADALKMLAKVSAKLQQLGYKTGGRLFEMPYSGWLRETYFGTCQPDLARCFDRFSDYFQTGVDEHGRRYYVRAHQLRRNFAMLFFWNGSFGGIEVLRYFLGHSKPSMTYRYITEAISGKVLRRVKASVTKDLVKRDDCSVESLSQLVCERYGLTLDELHILPEQDVIAYIEDLLESGEADVEPEFFNGPNGEEYRIVYKVKRRDSAANG